MVFPPISWFQGLGAVEELLQFVQDRVKASPTEWFQVSGDINAVNDTIEFIPASGKTAILYEAKIVMSTNPGAASGNTTIKDQVVADLKIDGVVKDKASIGIAAKSSTTGNSGSGFGDKGAGRFNALGLSLVGDAVKKITIENVLDNGSAFATMSGWLFTT